MGMMKTRPLVALLALAGAGGAGAAFAGPAAAGVVELGSTPFAPLVAPICPIGVTPANCTIILTQVTALETIRANIAYPTTVKQPGYIVAFTLGLSRLNSNPTDAKAAVEFLDSAYGGAATAALTVMKPVGNPRLRHWKVTAESPAFKIAPYLGEVVQFPLSTALKVKPPEVVALTVPTWAPVLTFDLPTNGFAYRQSRTTGCSRPPATNAAQTVVQAPSVAYGCDYPGTRVEYTATEVTSPLPVCAPRTTTTTKQVIAQATTARVTTTTKRTTTKTSSTSTTATCTTLSSTTS